MHSFSEMSYFVLFFRALEVDDKCEFAYETLGTVEVQRGNLTKAVQLFEKAIPLVIKKTDLLVNGIFLLNCNFFSFRLTQSLKWHTYLAFEMQLSLKQPFQIDLASQCQE